jgi:hypothetical protein
MSYIRNHIPCVLFHVDTLSGSGADINRAEKNGRQKIITEKFKVLKENKNRISWNLKYYRALLHAIRFFLLPCQVTLLFNLSIVQNLELLGLTN